MNKENFLYRLKHSKGRYLYHIIYKKIKDLISKFFNKKKTNKKKQDIEPYRIKEKHIGYYVLINGKKYNPSVIFLGIAETLRKIEENKKSEGLL
jgi:hypothetical protein